MEIISQLKFRGVPVENNREDSTEYLADPGHLCFKGEYAQ